MRAELTLKLFEDKKKQVPEVIDDDSRKLIECIRKFMREDLDDSETNQQVIGMKCLFRGFRLKRGKEQILMKINTQYVIEY